MKTHPLVPPWLYRTVALAHFINVVAVAATLVAYAIAQLSGIGTIMQFFLGCYQLAIAALATFAYWKWNIPAILKLLKIYWAFVLIWIVLVVSLILIIDAIHYIKADSLIRPFGIGIVFILPMLIACYSVYVSWYTLKDLINYKP